MQINGINAPKKLKTKISGNEHEMTPAIKWGSGLPVGLCVLEKVFVRSIVSTCMIGPELSAFFI
jgi:hypothetical protein